MVLLNFTQLKVVIQELELEKKSSRNLLRNVQIIVIYFLYIFNIVLLILYNIHNSIYIAVFEGYIPL